MRRCMIRPSKNIDVICTNSFCFESLLYKGTNSLIGWYTKTTAANNFLEKWI